MSAFLRGAYHNESYPPCAVWAVRKGDIGDEHCRPVSGHRPIGGLGGLSGSGRSVRLFQLPDEPFFGLRYGGFMYGVFFSTEAPSTPIPGVFLCLSRESSLSTATPAS